MSERAISWRSHLSKQSKQHAHAKQLPSLLKRRKRASTQECRTSARQTHINCSNRGIPNLVDRVGTKDTAFVRTHIRPPD